MSRHGHLPTAAGLALSLALLGGALTMSYGSAVALYISPQGDDAYSGKRPNVLGQDGPFRTLPRARDEVRRLAGDDGLPLGGVVVELAGGVYELGSTLELGPDDSGTQEAPVVYRAAPGAQVRLVGGRVLSDFTPVTDPAVLERLEPHARGKVFQTDLKAQGVTEFGSPAAGGMELFFRDRPMHLSRWPNEGFVNIVDLVGGQPFDVRGTKGDRVGKFVYEGDRPSRWTREKDLWLHGYWFWDWSDQRQRVETIDTDKRVISIKPPYHGYGYRKGQWYYAFNALSEIDESEEWYVDRETGMLYFWPPDEISAGDAVVSVTPTLISLKDVSHVTVMGMTLEACRGTAVTISGGTRVRVTGCTIRNVGSWAVRIAGGTQNGVVGCDIYDTGEGGIALSGGDRTTLSPGGHYASNNHIHHYSRVNRISRPGISLSGVGNRASHNLIHNAPHQAMSFGGNEHVIEFNEIHSVCYESNDAGAIYSGRNWTMRGHEIRYNYFHDISGLGGRGCVGVYLDDSFSSANIHGNIFYKVTRAAMIGGGRDNTIANNVFVDCVPSIHIDNRGVGWASQYIVEGGGWHMYQKLAQVDYARPPYSERYPALTRILDEHPHEPYGNEVVRNIIVGGKAWSVSCNREYNRIEDNLVDEAPGFADREGLDFRLREDSPAWEMGFEPIPVDQIGLYEDDLRASWPVHHAVRNTVVKAREPRPPLRTGPPPVLKVRRASQPVVVDGTIAPGEWDGVATGLTVGQGILGEKVKPASRAWIARDDACLLLAVDNAVDASKPVSEGTVWGRDDAVEIAVSRLLKGDPAPIVLLRGYTSGAFESSDEAQAPEGLVARAAEGVQYKAAIPGRGRWTCEWRIPLASLGIDPGVERRFRFNLSVRKSVGRLWLMWLGTGGHTWDVAQAGIIELAP